MTLDTYIKAQLARFAIEEGSRHGGINNMLAVAHVLRNRVFSGWGDWIEVVNGAHARRATVYPYTTPNIRFGFPRHLLGRIDDIYSRVDTEDLTGGALFYVDPSAQLPIPDWFSREVLGNPDEHPRSAHIGPVWFFK